MTMISAKTIRNDLVARLKAVPALADEPGGMAHVYPYFKPDPKGISPYCCVETIAANYAPAMGPSTLTPFRFTVTTWVALDGDRAAAEDTLDDTALALAEIVRDMHQAKFFENPTSDYQVIGGISYKFTMHFVEVNR